MNIDRKVAKQVLLEEAEAALGGVNSRWEKRIRELSEICEKGSKTHIAFLATALLARSVSTRADAFSVKARKGAGALPGSYSARGLVAVWTDNARALGVNLGVTGREPLNNQPYFGIDRLTRHVKVKAGTERALNALCDILGEIQSIESEAEVRGILRAFIKVRRDYNPAYAIVGKTGAATSAALAGLIASFVNGNGEGGKRAQAAAAGVLDVFAGPERVVTARVNDPDKGFPGDVAVLGSADSDAFAMVLEVRDKPVTNRDLEHFVTKVSNAGIHTAAVFAVASTQDRIDPIAAEEDAAKQGVFLHVVAGWHEIVQQALFWGRSNPDDAAVEAASRIYVRAVELEVSPEGVQSWVETIATAS